MLEREVANLARQRLASWSLVHLIVMICVLVPVMAQANPRIGLVIGNGNYQTIQRLDNPISDAQLMANTLTTVGFDVTLLTDGDQTQMKRAIAEFGRTLRSSGPDAVGLFYYAGHGIQSDNGNYLLPVDALIQDEADLDLVAVQADWVLRQLFSARNSTNIIILDACRNNPFEGIAGIRQQGLSEMNAPTGTFISYSSAPGAVALDGLPGEYSPFTGALSQEILENLEPIEQVFKNVRVSVVNKTEGRQTPWDSSSMTSDFYFNPPDAVAPRERAAEQLWDSVKKSGDSVQITLFLQQYSDTKISEEARITLQQWLGNIQTAGSNSPSAPSQQTIPPTEAPSLTESAATETPTQPSVSEQELIDRAQSTGAVQDYEAYLKAFPAGIFAALADAEIRGLQLIGEPPALLNPTLDLATPDMTTSAPTTTLQELITFISPLNRAGSVQGLSIAQIIERSPQYPPVDGLPDSYWKDQTCSNCHQWTQPTLCEQGKTYLTQTGEFALGKDHPMDGFKQVLQEWASAGCR